MLGGPVRRLALTGLVSIGVFVALALWNGVVAVLFGIAALTWLLAEAYRLSQGGDIFGRDDRR